MNHEKVTELLKLRKSLNMEKIDIQTIQQLVEILEKNGFKTLEETIIHCIDKVHVETI